MTVVEVHARPGSRSDQVAWDPWRRRWTVACRAPAVGGQANEALLGALAFHLGLPRHRLRWKGGLARRDKLLEVDGLTREEIELRLGAASSRGSPQRRGSQVRG
jgi:uncharacterized protein YggU (UPF0235/DUF167 family)